MPAESLPQVKLLAEPGQANSKFFLVEEPVTSTGAESEDAPRVARIVTVELRCYGLSGHGGPPPRLDDYIQHRLQGEAGGAARMVVALGFSRATH